MVATSLGTLQGYTATSFKGRKYSIFEGVPYAQPPVGQLRFEEPSPIVPWGGVLKATVPTTCPQIKPGLSHIEGVEDCLHLNVYVPREKINPEEKLEVVAYIHGGGFTRRSAASLGKPSYAMDRDIIYVSFNYRLGVLGFLSTEDRVLPGNNGFKDQVLALRWIQEHIGSFGGNSDSVTLVGLSSGCISIHLHYFSELSRGLFHRGFCQSGLALTPAAMSEGTLNRMVKLADSLQCPIDSTRNLVDCLKMVPYEDIINKTSMFLVHNNISLYPFGAVIEKASSRPFLRKDPYSSLISGDVQDLPFLVSTTTDEAVIFTGDFTNEKVESVNRNWDELAPILFDYYTLPKEKWQLVSHRIRNYYFSGENIILETLNQALTDRFFLNGIDQSLKLQSNVTKAPVYYYVFAYRGDSNDKSTVEHGAEVRYMFGEGLSENELQMSDLLWDMIVSYAKTNKPKFGNVTLKPTTSRENIYAVIKGLGLDGIVWKRSPELGNRQFWESFGFQNYGNY